MRFVYKFRLPGELGTTRCFSKGGDATATLKMEGQKMLDVFDALLTDDEFAKGILRKRGELTGDDMDDAIIEKLFGEGPPVLASTTGALKAQFDYTSEVAAAKAAFPAMVKKLGLPLKRPVAPPAKGGEFKSLKVAGIQVVYAEDEDHNMRPFHSQVGITLVIMGVLPGSVMSIKEGKLESALTDTKEELLPEREWDRKLSFPRLSKDKTRVLFDVRLQLPSRLATKLESVTGSLTYLVAGELKTVDLGIGRFAAGVKGTEYGARIKEMGKDDWRDGWQKLSLELQLDREAVKEVKFYDAAGNQLEVSGSGSFSTGGSVTFNFGIKGAFPQGGKIVVDVHDQLKAFVVPFKLENIDLPKRPD
jgi:hypothetical protein